MQLLKKVGLFIARGGGMVVNSRLFLSGIFVFAKSLVVRMVNLLIISL